ncbi:hypothetical protein GpartN1_g5733.t1 [Galdieria partita]|uniref:Peroxisomal ATPase PEX1 n=1 Tax=Galdieria partita TaxID=83374 RepID=A0A9C7USR4_9RHOD|nr:hypothetical protein GpartN1_g5733.t1 [Galdieria partita]
MQLRVHISKEKDADSFVSLPRNLVAPLLNSKAVGLEPIVIPLKLTWNVSPNFQKGTFAQNGEYSKRTRVAYVAWSGSSSSHLQTVEIGSLLAELYQLKEDQIVQVEPVASKDCQKATRVFLQTINDEDWSLIALHREYLEEVLLNQVRLVALGQPVFIRLSGNTHVVLVVIDVLPKSVCSLLEYDSIIQVEPSSSSLLENHDSFNSKETTKGKSSKDSQKRSRLLRILYSYDESYYYGILMHPKTAATLQLCEGDFLQLMDSEAYITACVILDSSVPLSHVMLHFYQAVLVGFRNGSRAFAFPVKKDKTRTPKSIVLYPFMDNKEEHEMNEEASRHWLEDALSNIHSQHLFCSNRVLISNPHSQIAKQALLCFDDHRLGEETPISTYDKPWHPKIDSDQSSKSIKSSYGTSQDVTSYYSLVYYRLDIHSCKDIVIHRAILPSKWQSALEQTKRESKDYLYLEKKNVIGEAPREILQSLYDHLSPVFSYYDPYVLREHHLDTIAPPFDVKPACCHFFHCSSGYGSTFLAAKLESKLVQRLPNPVQVLSLHLNIHAGEPLNQTCSRIRQTFTLAYHCRPCLITFMDSQEMFCHSSQNAAEEKDLCRESLEALVIEYMEACYYLGGIAILFVSKQPLINYPTKFLQPGLFAKIFTLDSLTVEDKMAILKEELKDMCIEPHIWKYLQNSLDGCSIKDIQRLVRRLVLFADADCSITEPVVTKALDGFQPVAFMGEALNYHDEESEAKDFSHIGGLHEAKELVRDILELPLKYSKLFASAPIRLASGALIYGPPGCGKTLLVRAAAKQFHLRMITVKGPELLNKYIGASEAAVRSCFHRAASLAPCILFFDELESLAPQRGGDSTGVSDRVVNSLLAELDGVEPLQKGVFVIAATSRPDLVDSALLRPGRLDKWIPLNIPTIEERKEIFSILLNQPSCEEIDLEYFARATEGYTGADLLSIVSNAHLKRLKRNLHANYTETEHEEIINSRIEEDLMESLRESVASLSIQEREKYRRIAEKMTRNNGNALQGSHKARVAFQ